LAKIADYLSKPTRSKILVPAFARALKDPIPRAKIAGLMSLNATISYYSSEDCAVRILPCVSPLTIDPDKEVRENAFKTLELFTTKLKTVSDTGVEEQVLENKVDTTVLGWAVSSITKKIYGDSTGTPQNIGTEQKASSSPSTPITPLNITRDKRKDLEEYHSELFQKKTDTNDDGWDDEFDEEDEPKVYKPSNPVKPSPIVPTSKVSSLSLKTTPKVLKEVEEDEEVEPSGWDNDGGDGWGNDDDGWDDFEVAKPKQSKIDIAKQKKSDKKT